ALVFWLDGLGEQRACILRSTGAPVWVSLPGSGKGGTWTKQDRRLEPDLYRLISHPTAGSDRERNDLLAALRRQRLDPLRPYLKGLKLRFVVPIGWAAFTPVEVLTQDYQISYVPSGSALARTQWQHRRLQGTSLLALGDPVFQRPARPKPPSHGVVVASVRP